LESGSGEVGGCCARGRQSARLDLRNCSAVRGEEEPPPPEPLSLPRGRVQVTILLPVGSEPGAYELQVLDSDLHARTLATGVAQLEDHVTTLRATTDVGLLTAGPYQLAIRHEGEQWRLFPLRIIE